MLTNAKRIPQDFNRLPAYKRRLAFAFFALAAAVVGTVVWAYLHANPAPWATETEYTNTQRELLTTLVKHSR